MEVSDARLGASHAATGDPTRIRGQSLIFAIGAGVLRNNIERRLAEHVRSGKISQEAADAAARTEVLGGKTAREIAEQRRINEITNGVGASDPGIANKVNPIGPKRQHLMNP